MGLENDMTQSIYAWRSDVLRDYHAGWIIVVADDITTARAKAREHFEKWFKDPYWDAYWDPDYEDIPGKRVMLENDIACDPQIVDCLFIKGSE
jgi:hypothetical protein